VEAEALARRGEPFAVATVVRCERPTSAKPGAKALIRRDGTVSGCIGGSCAEPVAVKEAMGALEDGQPRFLVLVGKGGAALGRTEGVREYTMTCHSGGTLEIFVEPVLPKPALVLVGSGPVVETLAGLAEALRSRIESKLNAVLGNGAVTVTTFNATATGPQFDIKFSTFADQPTITFQQGTTPLTGTGGPTAVPITLTQGGGALLGQNQNTM
jgi:xanthine dehydrogenase accessory factor